MYFDATRENFDNIVPLYEYIEISKGNIIRYMRKSQSEIYGIISLSTFFAYYKQDMLKLNPIIYPKNFEGGCVLLKRNI
ncbi:MAG: hypothetical protein KC589_02955 [Nanoarchaeota archaeon]|nr:hypothetical protein [Nanoarchaeota archaeon]